MTDITRNTGPAVFYATLAAGPIAIVTLGVGSLLTGKPIGGTVDPAEIAAMIGVGFWISVIAMIVALTPNLIGARVMGWLASRNVGFRHPAVWALAGAAACGVPTWLIIDSDPGHLDVASWAAVGALSALVCRWSVWWEESNAA